MKTMWCSENHFPARLCNRCRKPGTLSDSHTKHCFYCLSQTAIFLRCYWFFKLPHLQFHFCFERFRGSNIQFSVFVTLNKSFSVICLNQLVLSCVCVCVSSGPCPSPVGLSVMCRVPCNICSKWPWLTLTALILAVGWFLRHNKNSDHDQWCSC